MVDTAHLTTDKYKSLSFYSGFNYMRLVASGHITITLTPSIVSSYTILLPSGTYTPFYEVYFKDNLGVIWPSVALFNTGTTAQIDKNGLLQISFQTGQGSPPSTNWREIYYFVYRSNGV